MLETILNAVVFVLQLAIAGLAIWVVKATGRSIAWMTIAGAILALAAIQLLEWIGVLSAGSPIGEIYRSNEMLFITGAIVLLGFAAVVQQFQKVTRINVDLEQSQKIIQDFENRLKVLFENAPEPYYLIDEDRCFVDLNRAAERLTGYAKEEAVGRDSRELNLYESDIQDEVDTLYDSLRGSGLPSGPHSLPLRRKDGATVQIEVFSYPVRIDGRDLRIGVAHDVSERHRTLNELRERELRLRMITEQMPAVIATLDSSLCITTIAGSVGVIVGMSPDQMNGRPAADFLDVENEHAELWSAFHRALDGESSSLDMTYHGFYLSAYLEPQREEHGRVIGIIAVALNVTQQKKAQQELERSRQHLRLIVDTALDAIITIDADGVITDWNPQAEAIFGWRRAEAVGKNISATIIPDRFIQAHRRGLQKYLETREGPVLNKRVELVARHRDGYEFSIEMSISPIRLGELIFFSAFVRDITARKVAEEALRDSEERMELAVKGAGLGLWDLDVRSNTKTINRHWAEMLGYEQSEIELTLDGWKKLVHSDDLPRVQQMLKAHYDGKIPYYEAEYRMLSKSGEWKWILDTGKVVERAQNGDPLRMTGTHRDITERILAEEMATRFGRILDDSKNEIYIFDAASLRFLQANRGAIENTQFVMNELQDMTPLDLMPEFTRERFLELLEPLRVSAERSVHCSTEHRRKDGSRYPVEVSLQLSVYESSPVYAAIVLDVTERKRAEQDRQHLEAQLRRTQRLETIGTLAGGIAHDFNNILTPILGYTDMAIGSVPSESRARTDLEHVLRAAKRARDLVKQILTFSRQVDQERRPIRLESVVEEALKLIRASLPAGIDIQSSFDKNCGSVIADASQVHQVVMNLCTNAYHAMRDQNSGLLEVSLDRISVDEKTSLTRHGLVVGSYVRLRVHDTGCGMDDSTMERIFEPFFTTKGVGEGTGLGLSVVHGIVLNHSGDIFVSSRPGEGTTFEVMFPEAADIVDIPVKKEIASVQFGKERVLFVDDEEEIALMGKELLERLGYRVTVRTSSLEALNAFRARPHDFDIVVTDQSMSQMTGLQLASELKRIRPDIPIILITGFSETITPENTRLAGISEFVMKPVVAGDLSRSIRRAVEGQAKLA